MSCVAQQKATTIPYLGKIRVKNLTEFDMQCRANKMRDADAATSSMKKVRDVAAQVLPNSSF